MARPNSRSALVPAALRGGNERLSVEERETGIAAVETFIDQLGGRGAVVEALEIASDQPEVDLVLSLLADPRYANWSLRRLCQNAGLTIHEFFQAFRKASLVRAQIAATQRIADGIVPVVEDVMRRAAPYEITCAACAGTGSFTPDPSKKVPNPSPEPCKACRAQGKLIIEPELDRQKLALELADLVKKGGGIAIQQNQFNLDQVAGVGSGDLEKLQQAMSGVELGGPPAAPESTVPPANSPIDAEILPNPATPEAPRV